jgi:uncharacterized protein
MSRPPTRPVASVSEPAVACAGRLASLDLLRGVAILGILPMNVLAFGLPMAAYQNPLALGPISDGEWWAWRATHLLFDQRFMSIFAAMFGAGILLLDGRPAREGDSATGRFYRRMGWLLVIGLLHAHLLWYGDILVAYALCGMLAYPLRRLGSGWLVAIAVPLLAVPPSIWFGLHLATTVAPPEVLAGMRETWAPSEETIRAAEAAYRGGWLDQMPERTAAAAFMQTGVFLMWSLWRVTGLMLVGMVLLRSGFLAGRWRAAAYLVGAVIGMVGGVAIGGWGLHRNEAIDYAMIDAMTLGALPNYAGSLAGAFGWASAVLLVAKIAGSLPLLGILESIGRTSLSNYLLQTVLCTTIFYGHGLGWYGHVDRVHLWLVVLGVWIVQMLVTGLWLRAFAIGPAEWAWRSLAAWRALPLRRPPQSTSTLG